MTDEWPEMAEPETDDSGTAKPGSYPISVVRVGSHGAHNEPHAWIESAGCAYCNRWAVDFYASARVFNDGPLFNSIIRRMEMELIYFCDQHEDAAGDELVGKWGSAGNATDMDLADEVSRHRRHSAMNHHRTEEQS